MTETKTLHAGPGSWTTRPSLAGKYPQYVVQWDGYRRIYPPRPYGELEAEFDFFRR